MALASYTIVRPFQASPARLFRGLTEPADLAAWVWGGSARDVRAKADVRPGGAFEISMAASGREAAGKREGMRGVYVDVRPGKRLVHTLHWDADVGYNAPGADPLDEVVVAEIEPDGHGSRLSYTHLGIPQEDGAAAEHERSVRATFDVLARRLEAAP